MNLPSIKTIMQIKDVTRADAGKIRAILKMRTIDAVCDYSSVADGYVRKCFYTPPFQLVKLTAINAILCSFGIEHCEPVRRSFRSPAIDYCNTGDSYAATILWYNGRYHVDSWGDIVEAGNYD